jgi:hypothetical protein
MKRRAVITLLGGTRKLPAMHTFDFEVRHGALMGYGAVSSHCAGQRSQVL